VLNGAPVINLLLASNFGRYSAVGAAIPYTLDCYMSKPLLEQIDLIFINFTEAADGIGSLLLDHSTCAVLSFI